MPRKTYTREFQAQLAAAIESPVVDKDARIRELERKLAITDEEKEILEKAAAWFASESTSTRKKASRS